MAPWPELQIICPEERTIILDEQKAEPEGRYYVLNSKQITAIYSYLKGTPPSPPTIFSPNGIFLQAFIGRPDKII
jgi:hypothetical protein